MYVFYYASLGFAMCMHARKPIKRRQETLFVSCLSFICRGSLYRPENGSEFGAQRSVRMHIWHMHISIMIFSEMDA